MSIPRPSSTRSIITVLVADDHPVVRDGVQFILAAQPDVRVIATVGDASAALREAVRLKPDVAVMEITMPGMNGIDATRVLTDILPSTGVLILSMHSSPIIVRRAIDAGARGYLSKGVASEELVRAVRAVAGGKRYIGQGLFQRLPGVQDGSQPHDRTLELLTTTERNILRLVAEGKSNSQIASSMSLSPRTVESYRLRLMRKLDLANIPSLVKYAIRHGLIPLE